MDSSARPLGLFLVVMLVFGIITSLNGLAPLATYGLGSIFFLVAAIVFFWTVVFTGAAAMVALSFGWEAGTENRLYTPSSTWSTATPRT